MNHDRKNRFFDFILIGRGLHAAMEVDLPDMVPAFPSLPELCAAASLVTLKISGIDRGQLRQELLSGTSLNEILTKSGHTNQEAVTTTMSRIEQILNLHGELPANNSSTTESPGVYRSKPNRAQIGRMQDPDAATRNAAPGILSIKTKEDRKNHPPILFTCRRKYSTIVLI